MVSPPSLRARIAARRALSPPVSSRAESFTPPHGTTAEGRLAYRQLTNALAWAAGEAASGRMVEARKP